jgi:hypothetical protein
MLFSGGACSRRVSLSLKPFSFPRRCAKLEREREKELGVGRERENFVVVVLFCVECRGREERGKKDFKVFLGNEEKERILMSEMFFTFFLFSFFFLETQRNAQTYRYDIIIYVCIKTLTLKHKSIITPENVSLVKFKYLRNGESLTTRADKFDFLRATGRLAFEPNLVESVGGVERHVIAFPSRSLNFHTPVICVAHIEYCIC